jgi:hypothetical protein
MNMFSVTWTEPVVDVDPDPEPLPDAAPAPVLLCAMGLMSFPLS